MIATLFEIASERKRKREWDGDGDTELKRRGKLLSLSHRTLPTRLPRRAAAAAIAAIRSAC